MVIISNSERDKAVRYLELLCKSLQGADTRSQNAKRLARKLANKLKAKPVVKMMPCQLVTESSENE